MINEGPWKGFDAMRLVVEDVDPDFPLKGSRAVIELKLGEQTFRSPAYERWGEDRHVIQAVLAWRDEVRSRAPWPSSNSKPVA